MWRLRYLFSRSGLKTRREIFPEEILIDSSNPGSNIYDSLIEKPLNSWRILGMGAVFIGILALYSLRAGYLQIVQGADFSERAEKNTLDTKRLWAERGIIKDRNGMALAWNEQGNTMHELPLRIYSSLPGLSHILGFVRYPKVDKNGFYYEDKITGVSGVEVVFEEELAGKNGRKVFETSVKGNPISESIIEQPVHGKEINLTLDAELQSAMHESIRRLSNKAGFEGGGGIIMDSYTGEVLAITSFPEFNRKELNEGSEQPSYLNRATQGLYTPGSIVKPFIALAGLSEGVIDPQTVVVSTKQIVVPNPYNPDKPTIFHDWKELGPLTVRGAIANSPNSFFFAVGGGYQGVKGVGIETIKKYMNAFGIGSDVAIDGFTGAHSVVPSPAWKEKYFDGEGWRLGDTYLTSIGQYGFQVTPLHMARGIAAIANDGLLVTPTLRKDQKNDPTSVDVNIPSQYYQIVREGMAGTITAGTAKTLNIKGVSVAAKTGTAEIGAGKAFVNSWVVGFFPKDSRRYTFALVMEKAPRANTFGATMAMRDTFLWMREHRPNYLGLSEPIKNTAQDAVVLPEPMIR